MKPNPFPLLPLCALGCVGLLATADPAFADRSCDPLYQAAIKSLQTPHHVYSTTTHGAAEMHDSDTFKRLAGKAMYATNTESGESIFDGKNEYVQIKGQWRRSPMAIQDMVANAQEKLKTHPDTCTLVGDQSADGQAVTVYRAHDNESNLDQQVRILKSSGLMQGATVNMDGRTIETRYEYNNVQAPAGVK